LSGLYFVVTGEGAAIEDFILVEKKTPEALFGNTHYKRKVEANERFQG
jgi:hypothetical protein